MQLTATAQIIVLISQIIFIFTLGYYIISALQWYSYKIERVVLHYNKPLWHLFFFIVPMIVYYTTGIYFWIYFYFAYLPGMFMWYKKLDKPLVFTGRIKRYFLFLVLASGFEIFLCKVSGKCLSIGILLPILVALMVSFLFEKILFLGYKKQASRKLKSLKNLKTITITASYGKTSIKNFLHEILKDDFKCYKTPRSVNTLAGLVKDINVDLPDDTEVYISEAGARQKGDIWDIATLIKPEIAVVGEIGAQHIEYFKTLENIRNTKMELLLSPNLKKAFVHKSANANPDEKTTIYGDEVSDISSSIEGTKFSLMIDDKKEEFFTPILGTFNATNLAVCVKVALYLGLELETIKRKISTLKSVEHRLQKIEANGKVILDDSFNGNFEGMKASYELVAALDRRKVLLTPGIIESTKEENMRLGEIINDIFDVVIITSNANASVLASVIKRPRLLFMKEKSEMEEMLIKYTQAGDVILFSNDAPSFI